MKRKEDIRIPMFKLTTLLLHFIFCIILIPSLTYGQSDTIIDIDDSQATFTGKWREQGYTNNVYGNTYQYVTCTGSGAITEEATFDSQAIGITAEVTGEYAVYVRWGKHYNQIFQTPDAKYVIYDGDTPVGGCTLDQSERFNEWVYCDTVSLSVGNRAVVRLGNDCSFAPYYNYLYRSYVVADAVRFVKLISGPQGPQGEQGIQGPKGDTGATGAVGVSGYEFHFGAIVWVPAGETQTVRTQCSPGKKVLGGGYATIDGFTDRFEVGRSKPGEDQSSWEAFVRNRKSDAKAIRVYAICATVN